MIQFHTMKEQYPPGDFAIWIVIYIELITFGLFFIGYAFSRRLNVDMFNSSQLLLDKNAGFIDTILLLTSSYFIVKAIQSIKDKTLTIKKANDIASRWLFFAIGLGSLFLINKLLEFSNLFEHGINLSTNTFFMFYLLLTMFHFMHVCLGIVILIAIFKQTKLYSYTPNECSGLETGASYWHLIDLLWIVLFSLVYIIR